MNHTESWKDKPRTEGLAVLHPQGHGSLSCSLQPWVTWMGSMPGQMEKWRPLLAESSLCTASRGNP